MHDLVPLAEDRVPGPDSSLWRQVGSEAGRHPASSDSLDLVPMGGQTRLFLGNQALRGRIRGSQVQVEKAGMTTPRRLREQGEMPRKPQSAPILTLELQGWCSRYVVGIHTRLAHT